MEKYNLFPKLELSIKGKERNARIFGKVCEAILVPVLIGALFGFGSPITAIVAIIWWGFGFYGLLTNWEDFIIQVILRILRII